MIMQGVLDIVTAFEDIARLHRPTLRSTQDVPSWNQAYFHLKSLEKELKSDKYDSTKLIKRCDSLEKHIEELKDGFSKLVEEDQLANVEDYRQEILANITHIKAEIQQTMDDGVNAQMAYRRK